MNLHVNDEKYLIFFNNIKNILTRHQNEYKILKENNLLFKKRTEELNEVYLKFHYTNYNEKLSRFNVLEKVYFTKKELLEAKNKVLNANKEQDFDHYQVTDLINALSDNISEQIFNNNFPWIINPDKSIVWNVSIYNAIISTEIDSINNKYDINYDPVKNNISREELVLDVLNSIKSEILIIFQSSHYSYDKEEFNAVLNKIRRDYNNMILYDNVPEKFIIVDVRKYINKLRKEKKH